MKKQTIACCSPRTRPPRLFPVSLFKKIFVFSLIMLLSFGLQAQKKHVSGTVRDDKGAPAVNTSVVIKGTSTGVTTDTTGAFSIDVPNENAVLVVSQVGFQPQELAVGNRTNLNINLAVSASDMNEVIVVGYGQQKKVTVTGAVAQVKGSELAKSPNLNLSNTLAGRLPGVTAVNASGEPGYDGSSIRIRGTNSLGNTSALIVIDGVPNREGGFERLNPLDIESVSVLKDAAAAIYGSRAANGVILITTKRGKTGKPQLSYTFNQGWAQATRIPHMSDVLEYGQIRNESQVFEGNIPVDQWDEAIKALQTTGSYTVPGTNQTITSPAGFFPSDIEKYKEGTDQWGHPNTDWFAGALKEWAPQQKHNLQVNGGTETVKYIGSLGYNNQDGYYKNSATGYKQYDMRLNIEAKINKYVLLNMGITAREEFRFSLPLPQVLFSGC